MARKERRFDIQKTSYASAPCSAAARAVAQLGFATNSFGTVLATLPLIGAAVLWRFYLSHYLTAY